MLAEEHEDVDKLMMQEEMPEDPKIVLERQKQAHKEKMDEVDQKLEALKIKSQAYKDQTGGMLNEAKVGDLGEKALLAKRQQQLQEIMGEADILLKAVDARTKQNQGQANGRDQQVQPGTAP